MRDSEATGQFVLLGMAKGELRYFEPLCKEFW